MLDVRLGSCRNYIGFICWSFCAHAEGYQGTDTTLGDMTVNTTSASRISGAFAITCPDADMIQVDHLFMNLMIFFHV